MIKIKFTYFFLSVILLDVLLMLILPSNGIPSNMAIEKIFRTRRRVKRQNGGGYDAQRQDLGYGEGYGYSGYEDYCFDCNHCNGCGHQAPRQVLIEFDYEPSKTHTSYD